MSKKFIVYDTKKYFNGGYSQRIQCFTDKGENEPTHNTDTTYTSREIIEYDVTFSSTGKTVKRIREIRTTIDRIPDNSAKGFRHDYVAHYQSLQEHEGKTARELFKRLMGPRKAPFEVMQASGRFCDAIARSSDCIDASHYRDLNCVLTISGL